MTYEERIGKKSAILHKNDIECLYYVHVTSNPSCYFPCNSPCRACICIRTDTLDEGCTTFGTRHDQGHEASIGAKPPRGCSQPSSFGIQPFQFAEGIVIIKFIRTQWCV